MLAQLLRADLLPEAWLAPAAVRQLRALLRHRFSLVRLDPGRAARRPGQLRGRIQKHSQPSPAARLVAGPDPYALLAMVAFMGAAGRVERHRDAGCSDTGRLGWLSS